ncbi:hypothetical protein NADE_005128 [Nannochloris sp. 'desiccata']|nr:hypothetical protein KSW81_001991 [Chlorella desiccata (nom. nud.)]KAG7673203.1 hypothetical protein KSW81_006417 [Chlorella desiccata (nom. nud.)]KAH7622543.1 hypothetical protein NADE_005128 [Chlorella desiccata (nom. nud.)]
MSSKLVKKQLGTILASAVEKSQITADQKTKRSKTDQKKLRKQQKQAKQKRGPSVEAVRRANLQYFSQTAKPAATTQDLLAQALRSRGAGSGSASAAPVEKEADYFGFGVNDGLF